MDNTNAGVKGISRADLVVINPHPTQAVSCSLAARDHFGKVQSFRNASSSFFKGAKGPGTVQIISQFDPPLSAANLSGIGGSGVYTLSCSIPPVTVVNGSKLSSSILKYQISEHVKDDSQNPDVDQEP
jgi:hypothetical protein